MKELINKFTIKHMRYKKCIRFFFSNYFSEPSKVP